MRAYELVEDFNIRVPTISLRHVNRLKHEKRKSEARRLARQPVINAMYGISSVVNNAKKSKKKKIEVARGSDGLLSPKPPATKSTAKTHPPASSRQDREDVAQNRTPGALVPAPTPGSSDADETTSREQLLTPARRQTWTDV